MASETKEEVIDPSINELPPPEEHGGGDDELMEARIRKAMKKHKRKAHAPVEHDDELNIVALMDAFTIILVFLIKSYASDPTAISQDKDLSIPGSTTELNVVEAVPVVITQNAVLVADKAVVRIIDKGIDPAERQGMVVPRLIEAMKVEADRQKKIGALNSKVKFEGLMLLIADKGTEYHTVMEVLYSAGQAEFANFKFAAVKLNE